MNASFVPEAFNKIRSMLDRPSGPKKRLVGAEVERFGLDRHSKVLRYTEHMAVLFSELVKDFEWKVSAQYKDWILGVNKDQSYISLEPGAQFEIAGSPKNSLFEAQALEDQIDTEVHQTQTAREWKWVWLGVNPYDRAEDIQIIPSPRYQLMTEYFPTKARRGWEMMRLTSGFHLNIDFNTDQEAVEMLQAGFYLVPLITALFGNSPFYHGQRTGHLSERAFIWSETDPLRSGFLDFVFDQNFALKDYVNFVCSTELMYILKQDGSVEAGRSRCLKELSEELVELNALSAMRQIFTEIRLKPCCVELRSFDQQSPELRYAAMAFALGLIYDDENRKLLCERALKVSAKELQKQTLRAATDGLKADDFYEDLKELILWSENGLRRRRLNEEDLLSPVQNLMSGRKNPAQLLLETEEFL